MTPKAGVSDADMVASNRLPDTATSGNVSLQGTSKDDLGKGGAEPFQLHHVHDALSKVRAAPASEMLDRAFWEERSCIDW